jgi:hypothetical protein
LVFGFGMHGRHRCCRAGLSCRWGPHSLRPRRGMRRCQKVMGVGVGWGPEPVGERHLFTRLHQTTREPFLSLFPSSCQPTPVPDSMKPSFTWTCKPRGCPLESAAVELPRKHFLQITHQINNLHFLWNWPIYVADTCLCAWHVRSLKSMIKCYFTWSM